MYIKRKVEKRLIDLASKFPAVAIFGPRQSGKTTLAKKCFKDYKYVSFEDIDNRERVSKDPRAFLEKYKDEAGLILDEVQHVPHLLSYMQTHIDTYKKYGHFILTGSQNLLLNQSVTQSLAGRIAFITLLPLSIQELKDADLLPSQIDQILFKGMYPSIYADPEKDKASDWYKFYINSYIERDVRQLQNIGDLSLFQKFMGLCAGRIGQIVSLSSLSDDLGVSVPTVKRWLSVLEASYIIFLLQPSYKNFSKRLIKSPKLYFYDPAIAVSLLKISDSEQIFDHYLRGGLFETMVISDFKKQFYNLGAEPSCYFWRDQGGYEVDSIIETALKNIPIEIKSSLTYNTHFLDKLAKWNEIANTSPKDNVLVYGGDLEMDSSQGRIVSWKNSGNLIEKIIKS
jgi:uncharacterized protein